MMQNSTNLIIYEDEVKMTYVAGWHVYHRLNKLNVQLFILLILVELLTITIYSFFP